MSRGIIYGCFGNPIYLFGAACSAASLRRVKQKEEIVVFTNLDHALEEFLESIDVKVEKVKEDWKGYEQGCRSKPLLCMKTPFDETLYLDCDIIALRPLGHIWEAIERNGLAVTKAPHISLNKMGFTHYSQKEVDHTRSVCPDDAFFFNAGVFLWRGCNPFFEMWQEELYRFGKLVELAMVRSVYQTGVSHRVLPRHYNWYRDPDNKTVLYHMLGALHKDGGLEKYRKYCPRELVKYVDN